MASELQTQDREIDRNPTAASVSSTLTKELEKDVNNGYAFRFKLPSDGLSLRSVAIVDGAPELRFAASPKVPTISEEDMAVAIRLAAEGKRPEFFYIGIPFGPFSGRRYKRYIPQWLRGTSFGESLADADWNMKCLGLGARAKDHESPFSAWQETSNLDNLATHLDFPEEKPSGSSVKLSCKYATVEKTENELVFPKDPVMQIIDETSSTYTKYITEMYPSVAYHDEPLFLKMQELIKLVLAAEWLVDEKAVKISREWMMMYSTAPKQKGAVAVAKSLRSKAKRPPREFVPSPTVVNRPSSDVTVKTVTAEQYRHYGRGRYYGWCDQGSKEMVMFTAKGELQMSRKWEEGGSLRITLQFPSNTTSLNYDDVLRALPDGIKEVKFDTDSLELKCKIQPAPLLFFPEREITARVTVQNYDMLYADLNPNDPHWVGNCEVPNVESWNELHKETIPIPCVWQAPYPGSEAYTATGGVTTREIPVNTAAEREIPTKESQWVESDQYKRSGTQLAVRAKLLEDQGKIRHANEWEFAQVSQKFNTAWAMEKGACPTVSHVLVITNETLEMRWSAYRKSLSNQSVEEHYHGTELKCRITESMKLCTNGSCGVCGISSIGLDLQYIQKNIAFQRFGNGFYLAPNSSKCHDYTRGCPGYDFRAMLLCDVCPGKKYALERKDQRLTGPPHGFNSVYGVVGRELNYPELVVYQPAAVMPRYIILYKKDGVQHLLAK